MFNNGEKAFSDIITVSAVNFRAFWGRKDRNLSRIKEYIIAAARRGADLVVFPETALTGYENEADVPLGEKMQVRLAELVPGPSVNAVAEVTMANNIYAVFGMVERDPEEPTRVYNVAVACGPEGFIGCYRKIHPANDESLWCAKGSEPFAFDTKWGPVGVGICYDTYSFPELMRYYGACGARIYLNPTAMTGATSDTFDWKSCYYESLEHQVIANDMFVVSSNLVGCDIQNEEFANDIGNDTVKRVSFFAGASAILGPAFGKKVHTFAGGLDCRESEMIIATIDLSSASRMIFNVNPYSDSPDFRPKIYKKLAEKLLENPFWQKYE